MLFYEPLFVTFFPAFYALYLLATASITKKSALLIASVLFLSLGRAGIRPGAAVVDHGGLRAFVLPH